MREHGGVFVFMDVKTNPSCRNLYCLKSFDEERRGEKEMSKRSLVAVIMMLCMSLSLLVGCSKEEAVNDEVSSESSSVTEDVNSETNESEEVSEVESEEVVEEEFYSAQDVMALIDELTGKYQYNDPEHIKALVIAANLDYIKAEELDTILATYGYTMEELSDLYNECANDNALSMGDTIKYYSGEVDSVSPEREYDNRIALADVMLNESDKQFAATFDETSRLASHYDVDADIALADMIDAEYSTSGEQVVVNFAYASFYEPTMENPYATYQNTTAE